MIGLDKVFEPLHGPTSLLDPLRYTKARATMICLLGASGYYIGSVAGFFLTPAAHPISTYWPPNAILLAVLLLVPVRLWWMVLASALGAHLLVQHQNGIPLSTALGWFAGNSSEALIGAGLLYRISKRSLFNSVRGIWWFLMCAVFLAPLLTSFFDAAVVVSTGWGTGYWMLWMTRLFSDVLSALTIVPAVAVFATSGIEWLRTSSAGLRLEAIALALSVIPITVLAYGSHHPEPSLVPVLAYAPVPLLLWASLRFGAAAVGASVTAMACIAFHYVSQGLGPFAAASMRVNILFLQILLIVVTIPLMFLSAVLSERQDTEGKLREATAKLIKTQEEERHRIARELHDDIGQRLSLIELELRSIRDAVGRNPTTSGLRPALDDLAAELSGVSEAARGLSHGLHPVQLEFLGLMPALKSLCAEFERKTSIRVILEGSAHSPDLDGEVSLCLFRVAQEALNNVVKHSHATTVHVKMASDKSQVWLRVADNGVGFSSNHEHILGLGLANMKERLLSVGGSIAINSSRKTGTLVVASAPAHRHPQQAAS